MIRIKARGPSEADILIHQEIGENWFGDGLTSKRFADDLAKLGDVRTINVDINSPGGAVYDGVAIYNQLRSHGARINVRVTGIAASIASVIAMAGDQIEMGVGAMMMIHQPWSIAIGNADDMREFADVLDKHRDALVDIYAKRTGMKRSKIEELLRAETWMTGAEAVDEGFADSVAQAEEQPDEATARAAIEVHKGAVQKFMNDFRLTTAKLTPLQIAAALKSATADATEEDDEMRNQAASVQNADKDKDQKQDAEHAGKSAVGTETTEQVQARVIAAEQERRSQIRTAFGRYVDEHRALLDTCLDDPKCSVDAARAKLLDKLGSTYEPVNGGRGADGTRTQAGEDEADKRRDAVTLAVLARIGVKVRDKDGTRDVLPVLDNTNPFRGFSLFDIAEDCVKRSGVALRGKNRSQIVAAAFGHTTSDFPNLLENVMHKLVIVAYQGAATTWQRIARIGDLTDFRAHPRYRYGTFSDIKTVNEAGRYEQGTLSDAEKESITAKRKGRILVVTRELIVNDDLQAISDMARGMGRAANRTIDKDLYALFPLNTNAGPTMGDGNPLFHASHNNIAGTNGAPTVTLVDASRVLMAKQTDPSGNDFVDIRPSIALSPLVLGSQFRVLNESQYDPDVANKLQRPNICRGLFSDVVDTPRLDALSTTAWYLLADPSEEPVFEVGFLGGVREPRVEQDQEFNSDSLQWKVVHEYGVAAIGWRGIVKNPG